MAATQVGSAKSLGGAGLVAQKQEDLITIGFRVKPKEKAIIQDFVNRMYSQFVVDPDTNEPKRMLDNPPSADFIKLTTFSYMTQFNWFLQVGTFQKSSFNVSMT